MRRHSASPVFILAFAGMLSADEKVDFRRDVQPLFQEHCVGCHGPSQQMSGLRLDRRSSAMAIRGGTIIGPGNSGGSRLYLKLSGSKYGTQMPPTGPLTAEQINTLKMWIDQGAEWPDELSGDKVPSSVDPKAARMMEALRSGNRQGFQKMLGRDAKSVQGKGPGGSTPLMYAALYGDADSVRLLLELGAEPNIANDAGATALMWAADDPDKTRLLLEHGADPNASSNENRTALAIAVGNRGSAPIVSLLINHGAKVEALNGAGGDEALLRLLLDHGANLKSAGAGPLLAAIRADCSACIDLLMESASKSALSAVLSVRAGEGDSRFLKTLLDRGADAKIAPQRLGFTALMFAAGSESAPVENVKLLLEQGAHVNAKTAEGQTALDFAERQGETPVVELLRKAGAEEGARWQAPVVKPKPAASVRAAIDRSLPLLQRSDVAFIRKSGCVSCHNDSLTAMTVAAARKNGIPFDEDTARAQLKAIAAYIESNRERVLQGIPIAGGADTSSYILAGMAAENCPSDPATDALARSLKSSQGPDGAWRNFGGRPPIEASSIQTTATALRALQVYAPPAQRAKYGKAVRLASEWLAKAQPRTTEDRAFQLLGLAWAHGDKEVIAKAGRGLLAEQRSDGGWAQIPSLSSDAYATGQTLVALREAGVLQARAAPYRQGVEFLLKTQLEDGSWYVRSRSIPFQPYFESDFPHGPDQFISAAATNWAAMALIPLASTTTP